MIQESNVAIARMMGWNENSKRTTFTYPHYDGFIFNAGLHYELKFHSDWNWLMKAVSFVESKGYTFIIKGNSCILSKNGASDFLIQSGVVSSKIQAVHDVMSEFAKK